MKKYAFTISLLILFVLLVLTSCSEENIEKDKLTDQQIATKALHDGSQWVVASVDSKPSDIENDAVQDLRLSFGTTGQGTSIKPGSFVSVSENERFTSQPGAAWRWAGDDVNSILLEDGFTTELTNIQFNGGIDHPSSITATFTLSDKSPGGRRKGLGQYTITFD